MLDHVFTDAIGALRAALELALLERVVIEERFTTDALSGDTRWETSFGLPGEALPPKVQADITLAWPTWSQSAYRTWLLTSELHTVPELEMEVAFRVQGLDSQPNPAEVVQSLPAPPRIGRNTLEPVGGPTLEARYDEDLSSIDHAIELHFAGTLLVHAEVLADGNRLDELLAVTGNWIASGLAALG